MIECRFCGGKRCVDCGWLGVDVDADPDLLDSPEADATPDWQRLCELHGCGLARGVDWMLGRVWVRVKPPAQHRARLRRERVAASSGRLF